MSYITVDAEDAEGRSVEVLVSASAPPRIGDEFEVDGVKLRRLPSMPIGKVRRDIEGVVGWSQPRLKTVTKHGLTRAPRYNERGFPVFNSRREVNEYVASYNDNEKNGGHRIAWDPDGNE